MKRPLVTGITLFLCLCGIVFAEEQSKTLQNGLDGYSGCKDAYTYYLYENTAKQNYGADTNLLLYNCQT